MVNWFSKSGVFLFLPITQCVRTIRYALKNGGGYVLPCELNFEFQIADHNLAESMSSRDDVGVYVLHSFDEQFSKGEIITSVCDKKINSKGYVVKDSSMSEYVHFMTVIRSRTDTRTKLDVVNCDGIKETRYVRFKPPLYKFRHIQEFEVMRYSLKGALVVTLLKKNMWGAENNIFTVTDKKDSVLVICSVESEAENTNIELKSQIITHVNGNIVKTLEDYEREWSLSTKKFIQIFLRNSNTSSIISLDRKKGNESEKRLKARLRL